MESLKAVARKIRGAAFEKGLTNRAEEPCPACNGTRGEVVEGKGTRPCTQCLPEVNRVEMLREKIPERYRGAVLETLEPRPDLHPTQTELIAYMRANPAVNYYICGRNDTGKTHMLYALYDHAVRANRNVIISTLFEMVEAAKSLFAPATVIKPRYFPWADADLDQSRYLYSIFIEDIDKARPTEYVAELLFDYLDRIYRHKHQLVVTSQLDPQALIDHFEKADSRYGVGITRRIVNDETAVWRMF